MDAGSIASIIVATIALIGAYASQRAASKAALKGVTIEGRVDMERDAYVRARKFDSETIERQAKEVKDLRDRVEELEAEVEQLKKEKQIDRRKQYDAEHDRATGSGSSGSSGDIGPAGSTNSE